MNEKRRVAIYIAISLVIVVSFAFSLPNILVFSSRQNSFQGGFPVTVDPVNKTIVESEEVNALFENPRSSFVAAVGAQSVFGKILEHLAVSVADTPWYNSLAASDTHLVSISPGMRKEQVAGLFSKKFGWSTEQQRLFLSSSNLPLKLSDGIYAPGVYLLPSTMGPKEARKSVDDRFQKDVLSHYGTSTSAIVPLEDALTIASLIEREAAGPQDMRLVSGVIWNRLFINMPLQIDATLQYAKASSRATSAWWPLPVPADRFIPSLYNTYRHTGLPPGPIASPSVAAILAALNPKSTQCLFYFHDSLRQFHCTETYTEHVALLKKYYGRGK